MIIDNHSQRHHQLLFIWLILVFSLNGCALVNDSPGAKLILTPGPSVPAGSKAQIEVWMKNPEQGVRYRLRADHGICEPQESDDPFTTAVYTAPASTGEDRVTLEVWRDGRGIPVGEVAFTVVSQTIGIRVEPPVDPQTAPANSNRDGSGHISPPPINPPRNTSASARGVDTTGRPVVRITLVPSYDEMGGEHSSADIEGEVRGVDPREFRIVLYAWTSMWFVQPLIADPFTEIGEDGKWGTWTHTGTRYAALLVKPTFKPPSKISVLPAIGGDVVAINTVTGKKD